MFIAIGNLRQNIIIKVRFCDTIYIRGGILYFSKLLQVFNFSIKYLKRFTKTVFHLFYLPILFFF